MKRRHTPKRGQFRRLRERIARRQWMQRFQEPAGAGTKPAPPDLPVRYTVAEALARFPEIAQPMLDAMVKATNGKHVGTHFLIPASYAGITEWTGYY